MKRRDEMQISERELAGMTRELAEMHEATFPGVRTMLDEFSANLAHLTRGARSPRRGFLLGLGGVAALVAAAACSNGTSASSGGPSSGARPRQAAPTPGTCAWWRWRPRWRTWR